MVQINYLLLFVVVVIFHGLCTEISIESKPIFGKRKNINSSMQRFCKNKAKWQNDSYALQFALVTRRPYCPGRPKKLCFTTPSLTPMVSTTRLGVVKQSLFGLPGQYGRRVTRANCTNRLLESDTNWFLSAERGIIPDDVEGTILSGI